MSACLMSRWVVDIKGAVTRPARRLDQRCWQAGRHTGVGVSQMGS